MNCDDASMILCDAAEKDCDDASRILSEAAERYCDDAGLGNRVRPQELEYRKNVDCADRIKPSETKSQEEVDPVKPKDSENRILEQAKKINGSGKFEGEEETRAENYDNRMSHS